MSDPEDSRKENSENLPEPIQNFFHLAGGLLPALVSPATKAGERYYDHLRSHEPIAVRVLESVKINGWHKVIFAIRNQTEHGAYLESISVIEPQIDCSTDICKSAGVSTPKPASYRWLPAYLAPLSHLEFEVSFPECQNRGFDSDLSAKLAVKISRLDQNTPETKQVNFRLRWESNINAG